MSRIVGWSDGRVVLLSLALLALESCQKGPGSGGADSAAAAADSVEAPSSLSLPVVGAEVREGDLVLTVATTGQNTEV